jgi:hypothetical protein
VNGIFNIWGNFDGKAIEELTETDFTSFIDIFDHYYGITYRPIGRFLDFKIKILKNGKYIKR